ncbi:MAG: paraquat-inducible protein A [Sneathiella sp.]|nr:paraquat-inducible protein A [Sneathiella sp.]
MTTLTLTAKNAGVIACEVCHKLVDGKAFKENKLTCPRCKGAMSPRKKDSLNRTSALLVAALVLYIPANLFPIMTLISFGRENRETIVSGIYQLFLSDQWVIAVVVLFASVFVPVFKIAALAFLVISVQMGMTWRPVFRARLYRFVEWIGRWSMIDIFMISVLIALVKLKALATVEAGPGAMAFAAVVILTIYASKTFDPRLMWDQLEGKLDG